MFKRYLKFMQNIFNYSKRINVYEYWRTIISVIIINPLLFIMFWVFIPAFLSIIEIEKLPFLEVFLLIISLFVLICIFVMPLALGALINEDSDEYHTLDCEYFGTSSFWAYNINAAEDTGHSACFKCH